VPDPESNEIVRPGDVREYDEEPAWGPWELLDGPDAGGLLRWNSEVTPPPAQPASLLIPPPATKEM
jgi:hypothetical protein